VNFNGAQLLWRTRGTHWDHEFVLKPNLGRDWYDALERIFRGASGEPATLVWGTISVQKKAIPFIAARFVDEARRDEFGRAITSDLLVIWPARGRAPLNVPTAIPADWHRSVLEYLARDPGLRDLFDELASGAAHDAAQQKRRSHAAAQALANFDVRPPDAPGPWNKVVETSRLPILVIALIIAGLATIAFLALPALSSRLDWLRLHRTLGK